MISACDDSQASASVDMFSCCSNDKFTRSSSPLCGNFPSSTTPKQVVTVGICAMEKKSLSKPMKEILTRIEEFEYIRTTIFPEAVILNVRFSLYWICFIDLI